MTIPGYSGGGHVVQVDHPRPLDPAPSPSPAPATPAPAPPAPASPNAGPDAFSGIAPDVDIISIRQSSQAFGLKDAYTGDEDPQTAAKVDNVQTLARAIVHAANMGASVINISDVECMSARNIIDQRVLGAAVRYAAVDKNAVIVAAAGDSSKKDCKQNPNFDPLQPNDPRDWSAVTTVVTPSWFSDYVLTVGAVDADGQPLTGVSDEYRGALGVDRCTGHRRHGTLTPRRRCDQRHRRPGQLAARSGGHEFFDRDRVRGGRAGARQVPPAIGIPSRQSVDPHGHATGARGRQPGRLRCRRSGGGTHLGCTRGSGKAAEAAVSTITVPAPARARDMVPVWVAAGGLTGALLIAGAVFGIASTLMRSA